MDPLAAGEPVEENWYRALYEGDCVQVMRLLKKKPSLLKVGCSNDPSREVEGRNEPSREVEGRGKYHVQSSTWKGRNALHVAAWRGCKELILQVLNLCDLTETDDHSGVDEQGEGSEDTAAPQGDQSDQAESNGAGGNDHNVAPNGESSGGGQLNVQGIGPADATSLAVSSNEIHLEQPIQSPPRPTGPHSEDHDGKGSNTSSGYSLPRKDLGELLSTEDGFFGLDPFAMAGFHFNVDVLILLGYAYGKCATSDKECFTSVRRIKLSPAALVNVEDAVRDRRAGLIKATENVLKAFGDVTRTSLKKRYSIDREFNFLPIEEYLFHFLLYDDIMYLDGIDAGQRVRRKVSQRLWREVRSSQDVELWRFLLQLHDGQGRTPCQTAIDRHYGLRNFVQLIKDGRPDELNVLDCALTTRDTASRTPAHRAAVTDRELTLNYILNDFTTSVLIVNTCHAKFATKAEDMVSYYQVSRGLFPEKKSSKDYCLDVVRVQLDGLSPKGYWEDGLRRSDKPFHAAVLTKSYDAAKLLAKESCEISERVWWYCTVGPFSSEVEEFEFDEMEFACLARADFQFLQGLKEGLDRRRQQQGYQAKKFTEKKAKDSKGKTKTILQHPWPLLHLAAYSGNYEALKFFMDDLQCDPFVEDFEGNTPLHHAMMMTKLRVYRPNFLDFVSCEHFKNFQDKKALSLGDQDTWQKNQVVQRQGCINLLLLAGCDIFVYNNNEQIPYPQGSLSSNAEFLSWWYGKQRKEFVAIQNNLNFAANATAITAAVVATTSYVGPLTPPMGDAGDPNQLQIQNFWVTLFIVSDTLSFYLAIAAMVLCLIPSMPMPQYSMVVELGHTQKAVSRTAFVFLLPAIICIFVAFGASSFAVLSADIISSTAGRLTILTTCIGGLICLSIFFSVSIRLMACTFPGNAWVRMLQTITNI